MTGKPVDEDEEVKGYQRGENDFVMLEEDEIDAVALESTRTIDISTFVGKPSIDWVWYDRPHYLFPDDPVGEQAFSVIRDAMPKTKTVAISRLVLYRRERAVMLEPRDKGIVLWTLRYGDEVRDPEPYFAGVDGAPPAPKTLSLVTALIDKGTKPWSPEMVRTRCRIACSTSSRQRRRTGRRRRPKPIRSEARKSSTSWTRCGRASAQRAPLASAEAAASQLALRWAVRAVDIGLLLRGRRLLALLPPLAFSLDVEAAVRLPTPGASAQRVHQIDHIRSGRRFAGGKRPPLELARTTSAKASS